MPPLPGVNFTLESTQVVNSNFISIACPSLSSSRWVLPQEYTTHLSPQSAPIWICAKRELKRFRSLLLRNLSISNYSHMYFKFLKSWDTLFSLPCAISLFPQRKKFLQVSLAHEFLHCSTAWISCFTMKWIFLVKLQPCFSLIVKEVWVW